MKLNKSKKAAIMASILGVSMIATPAMAGNLFVGVPSNYANSQLGIIQGSYVTTHVDSAPIPGVIEDLNRDPAVFNINYHGQSKFVLREYTYSIDELKNQHVFDTNDIKGYDEAPSGAIKNVANTHAATAYGDYVYLTGYDLGKISVCSLTGDSLSEDLTKVRDLKQDIMDNNVISIDESDGIHGEGLFTLNNNLYVTVNINAGGGWWEYMPSVVMQYAIEDDGSLSYVGSTWVGKNTDVVRMNYYNNFLVMAAIGGSQGYGSSNEDSCLTISSIDGGIKLSKNTRNVTVPQHVKDRGLDFRDVKILPNGTAYVLTYTLSGSGGGSDLACYKTTMSNLYTTNPIDWEVILDTAVSGGNEEGLAAGWFNKIDAEYYTKRFWAIIGDSLAVYEDGATEPTYLWQTEEFSKDDQLTLWNSFALMEPDKVWGNLAQLTHSKAEGLTARSEATAIVNNPDAVEKIDADYKAIITGNVKDSSYADVTSDYSTYTFTKDTVIDPKTKVTTGDLTNNIYASIYAYDGNNITVNAGNHTLNLQPKTSISTPVGIYAGNGHDVEINAGKLNIIASSVANGFGLFNGIMNDAGLDEANNITINSDVNICLKNGNGGNGVAIQKTDRWGEASYASNVENTITINGNLGIKGKDSATWGIELNPHNVFSRFNNAGLLTQVENSSITVTGNVDMDIYGNGITTNAKNSTISIGGGEITVPQGMKYGYYTIGAYQGTVNVNTGKDGATVGDNDVKLNGDIFALNTGNINVALTTGDSYLHGIVDNAGNVNMWLQNGAVWNNVNNNERYFLDNEDVGSNGASHINKFVGGESGKEGVIYQQPTSKNLTIDNYSGNTIVIYGHDANDPTVVNGGNFTIGTAAANSAVTLLTDATGVNQNDVNSINDALSALANKLYYTNYVDGNLAGTVKLAEGLTASSAELQVGSVTYSGAQGQAQFDVSTLDPGIIPEEQIKEDFGTTLTGDYTKDKEYSKGGVLPEKNNTYNFIKENTTITVADGSAIDVANDITLAMNDNNLALVGASDVVKVADAELTISDVNRLSISANDEDANAIKLANATLDLSKAKELAIAGEVEVGAGSELKAAFANANSKLEGSVAGAGNAELSFANSASFTGNNEANGSVSLDKASWTGNNLGNATVTATNGATWNGNNKGTGAVSLTASTWEGNNEGNAEVTGNTLTWTGDNEGYGDVTLTATSVWTGDNTGDGDVTITSSTWTGDNQGLGDVSLTGSIWNGENAGYGNVTLASNSTWTGDNTASATITLSDSEWTGDSTGAESTITLNASNWTGNSTGKDTTISVNKGSVWTGYIKEASGKVSVLAEGKASAGSTLNLNEGTWKNTGLSKLANLNSTNGIIDMTGATAGDVTVDNYSGSANILYSHDGTNPSVVNGGNFTVASAAANSSVTLITDRTGIDTTDEDSINAALNALANKLYYTNYSEGNLAGTVKIAEGLTATSVVKQAATVVYGGADGQASLNEDTVTPGPGYPEEQAKDNFATAITGDYKTDKEYRKAGVLTENNATYNFNQGTAITVADGSAIDVANDITLAMNDNNLALVGASDVVKVADAELTISDVNRLSISANDEDANAIKLANSTLDLSKAKELAIAGEVEVGAGSELKAAFANANSKLEGSVAGAGNAELSFANSASFIGNNEASGSVSLDKASWTGNNLGNATVTATNGATWNGNNKGTGAVNVEAATWTGSNTGANDVTLTNSTWKNTGASTMNSLTAKNTIIDATGNNADSITVNKFSGNATVLYAHDLTRNADGSVKDVNFSGGNFTVNTADTDSKITLRTDRTGIDTYTDHEGITAVLDKMANKLFYMDAANNTNLSGYVQMGEGLTATSAAKAYGNIKFQNNGQGSLNKESLIAPNNPEIIYGPNETAMMRGAKSAMASTAMQWRSENADMLERMGDVRFADAETGLWAKYYSGKSSCDKNNTQYKTSYNAYQLGYDKKVKANTLVGVAISYDKTKHSYKLNGNGEGKNIALSVYTSWNGDKGQYADVILKGGKLDNSYTVHNDLAHKLTGDYDAWGMSLSAEYGRRMENAKGVYVEPSVQFTLGRVAGSDYSATSDFLDSIGNKKMMNVSQDSFTSAIGRIGLGLGKKLRNGLIYGKLSFAHEFAGDFSSTFAAENEPTSSTKVDFGGSWLEWQLGGNVNINDNSNVYVTFSKTFSGDVANDWRLDAGLRWSF